MAQQLAATTTILPSSPPESNPGLLEIPSNEGVRLEESGNERTARDVL